MLYVFEDKDNKASVVYQESTLTQAQKESAIQVEELPETNTPENHSPSLKCNKDTNEIWWEYLEIIPYPIP